MSDESLDLALSVRLVDQTTKTADGIRKKIRGIKNEAEGLGKTLPKIDDGFEALGKTIRKNKTEFGEFAKFMKATGRALKMASDGNDKLQKSLASTSSTMRRVAGSNNEFRESYKRVRNEINNTIKSIKDMNREASKTPRVPRTGGGGGGGGTGGTTRPRGPRTKTRGGRLFDAGNAGNAIGAVDEVRRPVTRAASAIFTNYSNRDDAVAALSAKLNEGKDSQTIRDLVKEARNVATASGNKFSRTDIISSEEQLGAAGYSAQQIKALIRPIAMAAIADAPAGQRPDIGATSTGLSSVFAVTGMAAELRAGTKDIKDATVLVDKIAKASQEAQGNISDLAEGLSVVGDTARRNGDSIEAQLAILSVLDKAGIQGSEGGRGYKTLSNRLKSPMGRAQKEAVKALGIKTHTKSGKFLGTVNALQELERASQDPKVLKKLGQKGVDEALLRIIGQEHGDKAANIMSAIKTGELSRVYGNIGKEGVTAESIAELRGRSLKGDSTTFWNLVTDTSADLGEAISPTLTSVVQGGSGAIGWLADLANENPNASKAAGYTTMGGALGLGILSKTLGIKGTASALGSLFGGGGAAAGAAKGGGLLARLLGGTAMPLAAAGTIGYGLGGMSAEENRRRFGDLGFSQNEGGSLANQVYHNVTTGNFGAIEEELAYLRKRVTETRTRTIMAEEDQQNPLWSWMTGGASSEQLTGLKDELSRAEHSLAEYQRLVQEATKARVEGEIRVVFDDYGKPSIAGVDFNGDIIVSGNAGRNMSY
jgi:TP901 family phage tail tape measure protein